MESVRLTHLDGKLPNIALMKLSHWHKSRGDSVVFSRSPVRDIFEPEYNRVYGSSIFEFSRKRISQFKEQFPDAILGGTGSGSKETVESIIGSNADYPHMDYSIYPNYEPSIGFTQRGCRLKCGFCVVPKKEGKNRSSMTIAEIWRGEGHPKKLHLLDNDFFGQEEWRARAKEIIDGRFKVCINQGINVRLIHEEGAEALASMEYRNANFNRRMIYTAWDNKRDEQVFFRGVGILNSAGIPYKNIMAYMLVGYNRREDWDDIFHRHSRMVELGILPYPMVYDCRATDPERYRQLKRFQRWTATGLYRAVPWEEYQTRKADPERKDLFSALTVSGDN